MMYLTKVFDVSLFIPPMLSIGLVKKQIGRVIDEEVDFIALHFCEVVSGFDSICDDDIYMILRRE